MADDQPQPHGLKACPACQQAAYRRCATVRGTPIYQCTTCGLATWNWAAFDPATFYDASYWASPDVTKGYADYFALSQATHRTHQQRLRWLRRLYEREAATAPATSARLLDAGCGPGFFVQATNASGWQAAGVEVSQFAVGFARTQLGQNVWQGQVNDADLGEKTYDVVTLWDVIEHLPDPAAALHALAARLRPGGLLALSTGDVGSLVARLSGSRWHLFTLPEHLWFHTRASLRRLLQQAGLSVVDERYELCWYTLRYMVERGEAMLHSPRWLSRGLGPLGRLNLPLSLGDIVTITARRD